LHYFFVKFCQVFVKNSFAVKMQKTAAKFAAVFIF